MSDPFSMDRFKVAKERDHALQRIIERLEVAKIFSSDDTKWGATYWRSFLKQICKKRQCDYAALETEIGVYGEHGLLKEIVDLPSKYPRYGWLRNKLKQ